MKTKTIQPYSKRNLKLTLILFLFTTVSYAQTIRRVNNNPGIAGLNIYTTLQAAHDAASNGDIIYLEPSSTDYGSLSSTKVLTIYGNGFFRDKNPLLGVETRSAKVTYIDLRPGSNGTVVSGIEFNDGIKTWGVSNITISRCKLKYVDIVTATSNSNTYANVSGISVVQNYIENPGSNSYYFGLIQALSNTYMTVTYNVSNVMVSNNYIAGDASNTSLRLYIINGIFKNNIVTGTMQLTNTTAENNIILTTGAGNFNSGNGNFGANYSLNSLFSNNVTSNTTNPFPAGSMGNQFNFNVNAEFTNDANDANDKKKTLKLGSVLKTAGTGGTEVGMFGGDLPFVLNGLPAVPYFTKLNVSATGSSATPLSVTVSTQSNN